MHKIHKTKAAEQDLTGIWLYTFQQWNETQADKYLDELDSGIQLLSKHPKIGKDYSDVREGIRCLIINKHLIFYCINDNQIDIIRVLHESMDVEQYL